MHAPGRQHAQVDAYGNIVHLLTLDEPHREIRIVVNGVVETAAAHMRALPDEGRLSPLAYLAETAADQGRRAPSPSSPVNTARDTATERALPDGSRRTQFAKPCSYEKGATDVHEPATQAFARGKGVCQDQAHVFIACCRAAGIPARYVSGYLYAGKDRPRSRATHGSMPGSAAKSGWIRSMSRITSARWPATLPARGRTRLSRRVPGARRPPRRRREEMQVAVSVATGTAAAAVTGRDAARRLKRSAVALPSAAPS